MEVIGSIDKRGLIIPLLASHSNYRAINPSARNLPKELVKEIIQQEGLIGLNLFALFTSIQISTQMGNFKVAFRIFEI